MKSLIIFILASLTSFQVSASSNTSPILNPVHMYVLDSKDFQNDTYIEFSVNDLVKRIASDNPEISFFRDDENYPSYFINPNFIGGIETVVNMGLAITKSNQGPQSSYIEFHSGLGPGSKWFERKDVSEEKAQLLTPRSHMRIALNKIPRNISSISISFKLWDMSNSLGLNLFKSHNVMSGSIDSPYSMDTQVVYFKLPWADIVNANASSVSQ